MDLGKIVSAPFSNVLALCITSVILCVILAAALGKAGVLSLGPFTYRKDHEGQTNMHRMDEENADLDDALHMKLRMLTNTLRQRIINMFASYPTCIMTKRTLSSGLRFPLYESIGNNHFTKELMPEQFDNYRKRILELLKDEYQDLCLISEDSKCSQNDLPPWHDAGIVIEQFLDMWLKETANLVRDCARQKLDVYNKYLTAYEDNKDKYRITITTGCIEKNRRYIEALGNLVDRLDKDIERRADDLPII